MAGTGYYIGLMSGTSMDGIDAALLQTGTDGMRLAHALVFPWPDHIKSRLRNLVARQSCHLQEYGELDHYCGQYLAKAALALLEEANLAPQRVRAIGSHGQTLYHHPQGAAPFSLQIGDPNVIAERTGITVVADFRRRDIASGGQGAPLVPAFHQAIFHHDDKTRVILNIGGIANMTLLPASTSGTVLGFDTGPGNCLMDAWNRKHQGTEHDHAGNWARQGTANPRLLQLLMSDDYFRQPPPKSTGTEYFNLHWLEKRLAELPAILPRDVQATLLRFTTTTIVKAIQQWTPRVEEVLVCGGGVHNMALMDSLSSQMNPIPVRSTADTENGMNPDWVEAAAFAWLAWQTLEDRPGNLPEVTGAAHPAVLGGIYL